MSARTATYDVLFALGLSWGWAVAPLGAQVDSSREGTIADSRDGRSYPVARIAGVEWMG